MAVMAVMMMMMMMMLMAMVMAMEVAMAIAMAMLMAMVMAMEVVMNSKDDRRPHKAARGYDDGERVSAHRAGCGHARAPAARLGEAVARPLPRFARSRGSAVMANSQKG